jgi:hypothetical protein
MVTNRKEHSEKTAVKQGSGESAPEPNKINASTPYDSQRRSAASHDHAGETRIPVSGGIDRDLEADSARHGLVPIRAGHCA